MAYGLNRKMKAEGRGRKEGENQFKEMDVGGINGQ